MAKIISLSNKRIQIDKANSTIVLVVSIAAFLTIFCLVASKSLLARRSYLGRVITAQEQARDQLQANIAAVDQLKVSYRAFVERPENIINGTSAGSGERDGDNAKIVLDALPSVYDFPGLTSSLEKIMVDRMYAITKISGTDNESGQSAIPGVSGAGTEVVPIPPTEGASEIPFEVGVQTDFNGSVALLTVFRQSIRPFYIQKIVMSASEKNTVDLTITGKTYYQPETSLQIKEEIVQ